VSEFLVDCCLEERLASQAKWWPITGFRRRRRGVAPSWSGTTSWCPSPSQSMWLL